MSKFTHKKIPKAIVSSLIVSSLILSSPAQCFAAKLNNTVTNSMLGTSSAKMTVVGGGEGYKFNLYNSNGSVRFENLVTANDGSVEVGNLCEGNYYFQETDSPQGTPLNNVKRPFSVSKSNLGKEISLTVGTTDSSQIIKINLKIKTSDVNFDNGDPIFYFTAKNGLGKTYSTFAHISKDSAKDENGYYTCIAAFNNLEPGTYTIFQSKTNRYQLTAINSSSQNVTVTSSDAKVTLTKNDTKLCTFIEGNINQEGFSDAQNNSSILSLEKRPVSIDLSYPTNHIADKLDHSKIKITITYDNGTTKTVSGTDSHTTVAGDTFSSGNVGKTVVSTITYSENGNVITKPITSIVDKWPVSLTAIYQSPVAGQHIDKNLVSATVAYCDGSTKLLKPNEFMISPDAFQSSDIGSSKSITASYQENTKTVNSQFSIAITKWPVSITGTYTGTTGETINSNNLSVVVNYSDSSSSTVPSNQLVITDNVFSPNDVGKTKNVKISYTDNGETVSHEIPVFVKKWPIKLDVAYSGRTTDSIEKSKIKAFVTYCDSTTSDIDSNNLSYSPNSFNGSDVGKTKDITASYNENGKIVCGNFSTIVQNGLTSLDISYPAENTGNKIDKSKLSATVHYMNGKTKIISGDMLNISKENFTGTDLGNNSITATFSEDGQEVSNAFVTTIKKWPTALHISDAKLKNGTYTLDTDGISATVTYCDGTSSNINGSSLTYAKTNFDDTTERQKAVTGSYTENGNLVSSVFNVSLPLSHGGKVVSLDARNSSNFQIKDNIDKSKFYLQEKNNNNQIYTTYGNNSDIGFSRNNNTTWTNDFSGFTTEDVGHYVTLYMYDKNSTVFCNSSISVYVYPWPTDLSVSYSGGDLEAGKAFGTTSVSATVTYCNGTSSPLSGSNLSYSATSFSSAGNHKVSCSYTNPNTQSSVSSWFNVNVKISYDPTTIDQESRNYISNQCTLPDGEQGVEVYGNSYGATITGTKKIPNYLSYIQSYSSESWWDPNDQGGWVENDENPNPHWEYPNGRGHSSSSHPIKKLDNPLPVLKISGEVSESFKGSIYSGGTYCSTSGYKCNSASSDYGLLNRSSLEYKNIALLPDTVKYLGRGAISISSGDSQAIYLPSSIKYIEEGFLDCQNDAGLHELNFSSNDVIFIYKVRDSSNNYVEKEKPISQLSAAEKQRMLYRPSSNTSFIFNF